MLLEYARQVERVAEAEAFRQFAERLRVPEQQEPDLLELAFGLVAGGRHADDLAEFKREMFAAHAGEAGQFWDGVVALRVVFDEVHDPFDTVESVGIVERQFPFSGFPD